MFRVVIADPDSELRQEYERVVSKAGFEVRVTDSGLNCVRLLAEYRPRLLVLDPDLLWGGDGILFWLSERRETLPVDVILQTNRPADGADFGRSCPAVMHALHKPIPPLWLLKLLVKLSRLGADPSRN